MIRLVCLVVLTLPGCGGGGDPTGEQRRETIAATESRTGGFPTYRSDDFSFGVPAGWAAIESSSAGGPGQVASAVSVTPEGTAPSSLVAVVTYDRSVQARETADNPRAWFDWFTRLNDAEVTQAASEIELDGGTALQGSLKLIDEAGNPVELRIIRAVRGDREYMIYCQAEPADRAAIAAGCEMIVRSFRAT